MGCKFLLSEITAVKKKKNKYFVNIFCYIFDKIWLKYTVMIMVMESVTVTLTDTVKVDCFFIFKKYRNERIIRFKQNQKEIDNS